MSAIQVYSETEVLEGVLLHPPGPEVENMTPKNAERALYSDILNLSVARREYNQLECLLQQLVPTFRIKDLLKDILRSSEIREKIVKKACYKEGQPKLIDKLLDLNEAVLAKQLIQGVPLERHTLTDYLSNEHYSLRPLHNFFFTRDASVALGNQVLISRMANRVREREAMIMQAIFDYHPRFRVQTIQADEGSANLGNISIEGGDLLVAAENITLVGLGTRTTSQGIDFLVQMALDRKEKHHILVQELPSSPESFIHLDMTFTLLDYDSCMVYEPLILESNKYQTIQIDIDNGKVISIRNVENLVKALKKLGMDLKPSYCGGQKDTVTQEREQWHSGANFFAIGPGKIIGYNRNVHTLENLNQSGYEIIGAKDVLNGKTDLSTRKKYVLTIDGAELSRGGGGVRCMTMPFKRKR
ncbi:MAG: arginine deiminase family protein [Bacteroidales bacterium]|nr:arginine deiminase family protein [Bacteroidales bacterium]